MPSTSTKKKAAAATPKAAAATPPAVQEGIPDAVERVDLIDCLAVGDPGAQPLQVTLKGIDFSINRWYSPETIWKWSDMHRQDPNNFTPDQKNEENRKLLELLIPLEDHDKIQPLIEFLYDRSIAEARRIFAYINHLAGLTDALGNPLAL